MRYREIISEAVPLSLVKPHMKAGNPSLYDDLFDRFKRYTLKGKNQRLYFPLSKTSSNHDPLKFSESSKIMRRVQDLYTDVSYIDRHTKFPVPKGMSRILYSLHFNHENSDECDLYLKGLVKTVDGPLRIGKLVQSVVNLFSKIVINFDDYPPHSWGVGDAKELMKDLRTQAVQLLKDFNNDPVRRDVSDSTAYYVVISRHPYDIAGMSTGRGWTSCTDLVDGSQRNYVMSYVKNGHLIAYLVRAGDWNLQHPLARVNLMRYERNVDGQIVADDFILHPGDVYGTKSSGFDRTVARFCKIVNRGRDDGLYCNHRDDQYPTTKRKTRNDVQSDYGTSRVPNRPGNAD